MKTRTRLTLAHSVESIIIGTVAGVAVAVLQEPLKGWMLPMAELLARAGKIGVWMIVILLATFVAVLSPTGFRSMVRSLWYWPRHWGVLSKFIISVVAWILYGVILGHSLEVYKHSIFWEAVVLVALGIVAGYVVAMIMVWLNEVGMKNRITDDAPIKTVEENLFEEHKLLAGRVWDRLFIQRETEEIVSPNMAIIGDYGSGKTSICNLVEDLYKKKQTEGARVPETLFCRFEGWQFLSEDASIRGLLGAATERIQRLVDAPELWNVPERYLEAISEGAGLWGRIIGLLCGENNDPEKVASGIGNTLLRLGKRLVIFVDDLDRMEIDAPLCQRAVSKALNQLQNVPNIQYVICVGPMSVRTEDKEDIRLCMDLLKLTRFQEFVPRIDPEVMVKKLRELRDGILKDEKCYFLWKGTREELRCDGPFRRIYMGVGLVGDLVGLITTPRVFKAVLRETRSAWENGLRGEIDWYDLVLVCALKAAEPGVFEWVARNKDVFLCEEPLVSMDSDYTKQEYTKQREKDADELRNQIFACLRVRSQKRLEVVEQILCKLFPAFHSKIEKSLPERLAVSSTPKCSQKLAAFSTGEVRYLERFFAGRVPVNDIPDQPILQYIRKVNEEGFDVKKFQEQYLASLDKMSGEFNKVVQFASLMTEAIRRQVADAILSWIAEPAHATSWPEPDEYTYDVMKDVWAIIRPPESGRDDKLQEWCVEVINQYVSKAPVVAIDFYCCGKNFAGTNKLLPKLADGLWREFQAKGDKLLDLLGPWKDLFAKVKKDEGYEVFKSELETQLGA